MLPFDVPRDDAGRYPVAARSKPLGDGSAAARGKPRGGTSHVAGSGLTPASKKGPRTGALSCQAFTTVLLIYHDVETSLTRDADQRLSLHCARDCRSEDVPRLRSGYGP